MAGSSDTQLEHQLSVRLHDEMSGIEPPPNLAATTRRRYAQRVWSVRIGAGISAVAAVAVAASMAPAAPAAPRVADPHRGTANGAPATLDVTYVSARTSAALGNLTEYVRRSHDVQSDGTVLDVRADGATGRERTDEYDAQGRHLYSTTKSGPGESTGIVVDYVGRSWWDDRFGRPVASPGSSSPGMIVGPIYDPAVIQEAKASGTLQVVGSEKLAGHDAVHLRWSTIPGFTLDLWVDATTYLPVRHISAGAKGGSTVDYTWLPRTPENLAGLDLAPPAGFTHRDRPDPRR